MKAPGPERGNCNMLIELWASFSGDKPSDTTGSILMRDSPRNYFRNGPVALHETTSEMLPPREATRKTAQI